MICCCLIVFFKVPLEIPLDITEDIHLPPKIVTVTAAEVLTVPCNIKAPGGTTIATTPT